MVTLKRFGVKQKNIQLQILSAEAKVMTVARVVQSEGVGMN